MQYVLKISYFKILMQKSDNEKIQDLLRKSWKIAIFNYIIFICFIFNSQ